MARGPTSNRSVTKQGGQRTNRIRSLPKGNEQEHHRNWNNSREFSKNRSSGSCHVPLLKTAIFKPGNRNDQAYGNEPPTPSRNRSPNRVTRCCDSRRLTAIRNAFVSAMITTNLRPRVTAV